MRIIINDDMYVDVTDVSFDLYKRAEKGKKTARCIGYYTSITNLVRKITMMEMSRQDKEVTLAGFVHEWDKVQSEITELLKEYVAS